MQRTILIVAILMFGHFLARAQKSSDAPVIPEADGFIIIPRAKMQPDKKHVYKAVYDATKAAKDPSRLMPALNMAGSELNALAVCKVPVRQGRFAIVFHGDAIDGILDNEHYNEKYGRDNPNLPVLSKMKSAGVKLYVCGQNLLAEKIDFNSISSDVEIASDALIVLMTLQNEGYALMSF